MVRRLIIGPQQGILLSRKGVDVNSASAIRLMDPELESLQVHVNGSVTAMTMTQQAQQFRRWQTTVNFPQLDYVPIVFVSGRRTNTNYIDYPGGKPPNHNYTITLGNGQTINASASMQVTVTRSSITVEITTDENEGSPRFYYNVMKNHAKRVTV